MSYDPNSPTYWDRAALDAETDRTFDICNGCRACFRFCPAFPSLFEACDRTDDVRDLGRSDRDRVLDGCFQCGMCYSACPYTEDDAHEYRLDFPRLMLRANAVRRREQGIPMRERILADPDRIGRITTMIPGIARRATGSGPLRVVGEKLLGLHRKKLLPPIADRTFETIFRAHVGGAEESPTGRHPVALFATCYVNWNKPSLGEAALRVLERNDCRVGLPRVNCCGMPALEAGDIGFAQEQARRNVAALDPWVARGYVIAVLSPTCSLTLRQHYPDILAGDPTPGIGDAAKRVAAATRDICEMLWDMRTAGNFNAGFKSTPDGPVACHAPCHLRRQSIGFRGRDLLRTIPRLVPHLVSECTAHDGTWSMKTENFDASLKYGRRAFEAMERTGAAIWSTDCPMSALQFEQACSKVALHPIEILDRAYRADGFPTPVEPGA